MVHPSGDRSRGESVRYLTSSRRAVRTSIWVPVRSQMTPAMSSHEDAERVALRVGVDAKWLVRIVNPIAQQACPEFNCAPVLALEFLD